MERPLLSLIGIFRNESESIGALLDSVKGVVDHSTLLDTQSTDSTRDIARERFNAHASNFTSFVFEEPIATFDGLPMSGIIDFAKTRNRSIELEQKREDAATFVLSLSGDETLVEERPGALREFLEQHRTTDEGAFCVAIKRDNYAWPYPRILRVDSNWRYKFPIHETPAAPDGTTSSLETIPDVHILYAPKGDMRLLERMKKVDIPVLTWMAEQKGTTHDELISKARAFMFLGQTHENLAVEHDKEDPTSAWVTHMFTALSFYQRRAAMEGDRTDAHYALFHSLEIMEKLGSFYTHEEFIPRYVALCGIDPDRPELRYKLALHAGQIDARLAAKYAMEAVAVARAAKTKQLPFVTDARIEWLSLQIAAEAAKILKMESRASALANEGLAAGGPREAFEPYLGASA